MKQKELRWMRLDNAAKVYPASKRRNWLSAYRVSVSLSETVDPDILQSALASTIHRFPSMAVRLRRGLFWYYLEELPNAPTIIPDHAYPFADINYDDMRNCCFRVLYYSNRISLEIFHVITDGTGAMVFLKSLAAEYLRQKYHVSIPATNGVCDVTEPPKEQELEDSFMKYSSKVTSKHKEATAFRMTGTRETDGFLTVTTGILSLKEILPLAKSYNVSLTVFLAAVMLASFLEIQEKRQPIQRFRRPVKVLIPVNLRNHFESSTLRNFVLYIIVSVAPALGHFTFDEIIKLVYHQLGAELTDKQLNARFAGNVNLEKIPIIKVLPLFVKNFFINMVFKATGEKKSCISISNLGAVKLPAEMKDFVKRFDFILGMQSTKPNNCAVISYGDNLYINFIRNIKEPTLERVFFTKLRQFGLHVKIESNSRNSFTK